MQREMAARVLTIPLPFATADLCGSGLSISGAAVGLGPGVNTGEPADRIGFLLVVALLAWG